MADYGVTDEQFNDLLGNDKNLDQAITYYLDMNDYDEDYDDDEYDEDY